MSVKVTIEVEITDGMIYNLLCCALEGGSNYWYQIKGYKEPAHPMPNEMGGQIFKHLDYPTSPDGGLYIYDSVDGEGGGIFDEKHTFLLDKKALEHGIELMAREYPERLKEVLEENEDADTGDLFLQLCVFGEVIYG